MKVAGVLLVAVSALGMPFALAAQTGPPEVHLAQIYGEDWKIIITYPDEETIHPDYKLTIWKNSSYPEKKTVDVFSGQTIEDLEPENTYCLTVKEDSQDSTSSPEVCIQTPKAWPGLPRPENVHICALNMKCILYWNNTYDENVNFTVQLLDGYQTKTADISTKWHNVPGCENIQTMHCDISSALTFFGIFYLRVQAIHNNNTSPWSKMLKFEPQDDNELGSPGVTVNADIDSLNIVVAAPGESENRSMSEFYELTYRIHYWMESSSYSKEKIKEGTTLITISDLTPDTSYCLKVQALSRIYNKSSTFSNVTCARTIKEVSLHFINGVAFLITLAVCVVIVILTGAMYFLSRKIKHVFFPSCHPPLFIENPGGKKNSVVLLVSEEPTEKCIVMANGDLPKDVKMVDFKYPTDTEQISQDSGNYSSYDGISGHNNTPDQKTV